MSLRAAFRFWPLALSAACLFACAFAVTGAAGATLTTEQSSGLWSAQIDGPALYWFQRFSTGKRGRSSGRVLRRNLFVDPAPKEIYSAADSYVITGFNARHGRIAVAEHQIKTGDSRVLELKQQGESWLTTELLARSAAAAGERCYSRARLITINPAAEIVVDDMRATGLNGQCVIQRPHSTLTAIAADGSSRLLQELKGPWSTPGLQQRFGRLSQGAGDWAIWREDNYSDSGRAGLMNLATGEFSNRPEMPDDLSHPEVAIDGRMLVNDAGFRSTLFTDPKDPAAQVLFKRRYRTSWFHFCGEKILEVTRRSSPDDGKRKRRAFANGSRWNLWILNMNGQRERRLPQRLRRGTGFEACDAGQAVFHRYLHKGGARQFSVPLG